MELEEMKAVWSALEHKLDESEKLNRKLLRDMAERKSFRRLNGLLANDMIGLLLCLLVLPYLIYRIGPLMQMKHPFGLDLLIGFLSLTIVVGVLASIYKLRVLVKIDPSASLRDNLRYLEKYNRVIAWERKAGYFFVGAITLAMGCIAWAAFSKIALWRWAVVVVSTLIVVIVVWYGYNRINAKLRSIKEGLEELDGMEK